METRHGWNSGFPVFAETSQKLIREALHEKFPDYSGLQDQAWKVSIPSLQHEVEEAIHNLKNPKEFVLLISFKLEFYRFNEL